MIGTSINPLPLALRVEHEKFRVTRWLAPSCWVSESSLSIVRVLESSSNNGLPSNEQKSLKDPDKKQKKKRTKLGTKKKEEKEKEQENMYYRRK